MRRCAIAVGVLTALVVPSAALAHATLSHATPSMQSSIDAAPAAIELRYDQAIVLVPHSIEVLAADGTVVSGTVTLRDHGRVMHAPLRKLSRGAYTVRWRQLSSDGHVGSGVFTFGIGVPAPPPTEAVGATGLTWRDDLARWAAFAALALLLGPLTMRLVVLRGRPLPARFDRSLHLTATIGAFAVINVAILAFVLKADNALQLGFVDLMYGNLEPFAENTRFGIAFLVTLVGFAMVATISMISWVLDRPRLLWAAFALALALAAGFSLSGHQATEPNSTTATQLADWAHLIAASIWAGGLLTLAVLVWRLAPELRRHAFLGFSRIATVLIAVLVLAGTYLAIVRLPQASDLWTTSYGRVLLFKLAVVGVALAWGGFHHTVIRPRIERGEVPRGVGRSLLGESAVAMVVLLAAAVLVNGAPPAPSTSVTSVQPAASR